MDAHRILETLHSAGLSVELAPGDGLKLTPASRLTDELRQMIRANKPGLIHWLKAANDGEPDPDRWCWPNGDAMNSMQLSDFAARVERFTDKGLPMQEAERLADALVIRDRELDGRRLCLECQHLRGMAGRWRCGNWQAAGIATTPADSGLPADLVTQLQRCDGFLL